ncbi:hypothetical protein Skr01_14960 [Sphaerisporangium krabiense]|uniref:DUF7847 domain-containing protein n=1 Tax=Sphaerisporangium krabiense TaxID=763782 RepID=A0A7W8YZL6_9ACTN|nr:glycerophosphoryl diester phosphodiesterase membrane domain-containing protein [Sphaerisporangium krabiense]MBB5624632.1 hypothetical protein [Sphaerisporangium krabiense]GII61411.1 hypothetical protein Skr01_14960 [Sphaerisporangium krabiense]
MSDGHGSASSTPGGWAQNQPPPYSGQAGAPWTSPGDAPPADQAGQGQVPPGQNAPPQDGQAYAPGQQGPYGYGQQDGGQAYGRQHGGQAYGQDAYGQQYGRQQYGYSAYGQGGQAPPPAAPRPGIIPLRPLGVGDILDGTIKLIRSNPKATLGLSAIAAAVGTLPLAIGQAIYFNALGGMLADPSSLTYDTEAPVGGAIAQLGGGALSYIMQFFLVTMLTGVLTRILGRAVFGGRITIGEAWRLTRPRLPALLGLAVLTALIVLAPLALIVLLLVALAAIGTTLAGVASAALLLGLGYLVYALIMTTRLALAPAAVVLEGRGVFEALRRSWGLVGGAFWRTLGILVLTMILTALIGGILSVPVNVLTMLVTFTGRDGLIATVLTTILLVIGGILTSMITYPLQAGVNGLLYTDRRMRAEAFDLVLRTAAAEQYRQGWVSSAADDLWHPSHAAGHAGGYHPQDPRHHPYAPGGPGGL